MPSTAILGLIVAALGGAAIGVERQWSGHADGAASRFAGVRTFTMIGAAGGLAGWLSINGAPGLGIVLAVSAAALIVVAYAAASRRDIDGTTEVAAIVVLGAGILSGLGWVRFASAIIALQSLLLLEKTRLHAFVRRIDDVELRAAVRFGVMALVILPLLPEGPFGPRGIFRPRELWILVLFFSGLSYAGHLARRIISEKHGSILSGIAGGLVSSTSVTLTFARASRRSPSLARPLAFGTIGANAILYWRVVAATAALNPALVLPLVPYLAGPALIAIVAVVAGLLMRRDDGGDGVPALSQSPLQLSAALQVAAMFQVVIAIVAFVRDVGRGGGLLATAFGLGLTDVDALTVSMARDVAHSVSVEMAALAIAVGVLANTLLKLAIALTLGSASFRLIVGVTLALMAAASAIALAL